MKGSCRYSAMAVNEPEMKPFRLNLKHHKLGGTTWVFLHPGTTWTSSWNMLRDIDTVREIKRGITEIISRHRPAGLVGLIVDQMYRTGHWVIEPEA